MINHVLSPPDNHYYFYLPVYLFREKMEGETPISQPESLRDFYLKNREKKN
ncbi:hypothetical protein bcere0020_57590 [Bacillus cereus Rock3-29]|nr:hypothetical protein bcere0020_57590 [Bacillus cereus Rock3-29]